MRGLSGLDNPWAAMQSVSADWASSPASEFDTLNVELCCVSVERMMIMTVSISMESAIENSRREHSK